MIITVLALAGTLIGATTIAGLLTFYQIRQSTDIVSSAKAIFAADSGFEWGLYNYFKNPGDRKCPETEGGKYSSFDLSNKASFKASCVSVNPTTNVIKSKGEAVKTYRALEITIKE